MHNGVVVIQRFLGCDLQEAVAVTNGLVTSQLYHFEHIIDAELPLLFDESGLEAADREIIRRYLSGVQDVIAGFYQGHLISNRYVQKDRPGEPASGARPGAAPVSLLPAPTGMGTAAARFGSVFESEYPSSAPAVDFGQAR